MIIITSEKIAVLSFDRKYVKIRQIREIVNGNFYFTKKLMFCHLTENPT